MHWFVAVTAPRAERIAQMQLAREGVETFLPLKEDAPTLKTPINVKPIWPGYLFVTRETVPESVSAVRSFIVGPEGRAVCVPDGLVESLMDRADADGLIDPYVPPAAQARPLVGQVVRMLYGTLAGHFATVERLRGSAMMLEIHCQGVKWMIKAKVEQVALVA